MTTMNESTPLVRARALDGDAEDAQTAEQHAVDRTARRTRASVRAPITLALSWVFLLVVAATYYHSNGFDSVKRATRTVKGVRVFDDDGDRLQSARVCESAFANVERVDDAHISVNVALASGLERIYERTREEATTCESAEATRDKVLCVNATEVWRCAERAGVLLPNKSIQDRYLIATVIKHAQESDVSKFAFVDGRAEVEGALAPTDQRALGVLIDSDKWNAVRLTYDATIAVSGADAAEDACPHQCRCKFSEGKLCELRSSECQLNEDSFFVLRHDAYGDVLEALPHAVDGSSALKNVFPQWLVVPPFKSNTTATGVEATRPPALGLPLSCVEKDDAPTNATSP